MKSSISVFITLVAFAVVVTASSVAAQDSAVNPDPAFQQNEEVMAPGTVEDGTTPTNGINFNPWWLLPLLLIPIAYWVYRSSRSDNSDYTEDVRYAGRSGGEAGYDDYEDMDADETTSKKGKYDEDLDEPYEDSPRKKVY